MRIIVPLAGPDFELGDGTTRAERIVEGRPLLRLALESRSWWRDGSASARDIVFILRDTPISRHFAETRLATWYPGASATFLGKYTRGAALTTLAGIAMDDGAMPLCVDLADIVFDEAANPIVRFAKANLGGLLLTFPSSNPAYSYAEKDSDGHVVRTSEKQVISNEASAGVYFFKDAPTLLRAIAHGIENQHTLAFNGLLYICPMFNGVIAGGGRVETVPVDHVRDIKVS